MSIRTVPLPDEDVPPGEDELSRAARLARREQARADAQARAEQRARDARRELIRLNKEADAAQSVRREFLRSCLTAKPRHKQMTGYALRQLLARDRTVTDWFNDHPWPTGEPAVLAEILGDDPVAAALAAPAPRHPVMLWAYVVAAHEKAMPRDAHRGHDPSRADYLRHLADLGYVPAEVEQRIVTNVYGDHADTADIADTEQTGIAGPDAHQAHDTDTDTDTGAAEPDSRTDDPAGAEDTADDPAASTTEEVIPPPAA